jgi:chaperonin GroES
LRLRPLSQALNEAINTTLNQMFDAGHLQIAGGGFIGSGLSLHAGATNFSIGEYKPVNTKGGNIRDNVFPIPWPGPNAVLFQMLGFLVGAGKEIASIQDVLTGDAAMANTPPTTMLALVDQGMKVYTAIYKRIYRALKSELKKLYRLNRIYLTKDERYQIGDTWRVVTPDDYRLGGGVEPIADPTMVTDMQRITRAALIVDRAKNNPLINPLAAERYLFQAAQIPRVDDFLPEQMPPKQPSPEENKAILEQHRLQFEMQESQSKLGLTRAQELQAYTTAMLNFAKAKGEMSGPQIEWMEAQLTQMRLHIEALNTTVKAAAVDAKMHSDRLRHHGVLMGHAVQHSANMADTAARARETADEQPGSADNGGGSPASPDLSQPGGAGDGGSGIPAVAPQSGNTMLPPIPGA